MSTYIQDVYDDEPNEPTEGDYILSSCGELGSKAAVSIYEGKFLREFREESDARNWIQQNMLDHGFFPNVWKLSDHGNWILI